MVRALSSTQFKIMIGMVVCLCHTLAVAYEKLDVSAFDESSITELRTEGEIQEVRIIPTDLELQHQWIDLPSGAKGSSIGLLSLFYHFKFGNWFGGLGGHAATFGGFGGLNGVGVEGGYRFRLLGQFFLRGSLGLSGASGIAVRKQGSGLLLRSILTAEVKISPVSLGVGVAYASFPSGTVRSMHPILTATFESDFLHVKGRPRSENVNHLSSDVFVSRKLRLAPVFQIFVPSEGQVSIAVDAKQTSKPLTRISLFGIRANHFLNESFFTEAQLMAAMSGASSGYMTLGVGGGYHYPLSKSVALEPFFMTGGEGSGALFVEPGARAVFGYHSSYSFQFGTSYLRAVAPIKGGLRTMVYDFAVALQLDNIETRTSQKPRTTSFMPSTYKKTDWRFRLTTMRYFVARYRAHHGETNTNVDVMGLGLDYLFNSNFFFGGAAYWPITGQAGGYATAQIGPGYEAYLSPNWSLEFDLKGGVMAGGEDAAGMAFLITGGFGGVYYLTPKERDLSVGINLRKLNLVANTSTFSTELGLRWAFGLPNK